MMRVLLDTNIVLDLFLFSPADFLRQLSSAP